MKKKFFAAIIFIFFMISLAEANFKDDLLKLSGVVSVDEIVQSSDKKVFAEKYLVTFRQPLSWKDQTLGNFTQRVEIGFAGYDNPNVVNVGGYELYDKEFPKDDRHELAKMYNANFINIEYRFFSKSAPAGLSKNSTDLWEYLTDENASYDFHNIIEQLKEILSGNWAFTGTSKGGQATNIFAYYFPTDAQAYVSYVAPFCNGIDDPRGFEALYSTIGNERYGEKQAKKYRDLVLNFQVEAIKNRDYVQPQCLKYSKDYSPYPLATASKDFEAYVADFGEGVWQYEQNFASLDEVMKIFPQSDDPLTEERENKKFLDAMVSVFKAEDSDEASFFPYMVQAAVENGNYALILKPLRDELEKFYISLDLTEETEKNYNACCDFTKEQLEKFKFKSDMREKMLAWTNTNTSNVIMIYGDSDPWYFMRLPETDNENIHVFTSSRDAHNIRISKMADEQKNEITALITQWLQQDTTQQHISSSGGGCNAAGLGYVCLAVLIFKRKKIF